MSLDKDYNFRKLLETQSNKFSLVLDVAKDARQMATEYDELILHSEAITHILHGTKPKLKHIWKWESEAREIRDTFCSIEDKEVCDAVYDSFYASKEAHNLKYVYNTIKDPYRQARVRILTRMLWKSLYKI
jgi:hypothetical protein